MNMGRTRWCMLCMQPISSTFIHSIDREDILAFTKTLDDVIDGIHHASQAFSRIYELTETLPHAQRLADLIFQECKNVVQVCKLLRKPSVNLSAISQLCVEIHRLENEADDCYVQAKQHLFKELQYESVLVTSYLAWTEIYAILEHITDKAEDCANIAEQIAIKYA